MDFLSWLAIVILVAVIGGVTSGIVSAVLKSKREIAEIEHSGNASKIAAEVTASTDAISARLDTIEKRLGAIEKTLTDIPQ